MSRTLAWKCLPLQAMSVDDLHAILKLRVDVFVVEQQCAYAEIDGQDPHAIHLFTQGPHGEVLAYARLLPPGADGHPHIGRVVVHPAHRGEQLGRTIMIEAITRCRSLFGPVPIALSAQAHLHDFYCSLGFQRTSDAYDWDGIPHIDMRLI
jgi:ElaA protein